MQKAVSHDVVSRPTTVPARTVEQVTQPGHTPRPAISTVGRDTLSTFSARSAATLVCALIGFAAPHILGKWLDTHARLSAYARTRSVVVLYDEPPVSTLLIEAIAGLLALTFARGAITWMALHGSPSCGEGEDCGSFGKAVRKTLTLYPALLVSTSFYGMITSAGIVGTSALTQPIEYNRDKIAHVWAGVSRSSSDVLRQLVWRSLNTLTPDPGPPFAQFMPDLRRTGLRDVATSVALGSITLILVAETLLRFRTVVVLKPPRSSHFSGMESGRERPRRFAAIAPLIASASFGLRHFGVITVHIWIVRLAIFALSVAFIEFPLAIVDNLIVPYARLAHTFEVLPVIGFLEATGAALVSAILLAFSIVYDARLFAALSTCREP